MNYLDSASVDVTYRCNLRCRHCFDFGGECVHEEMNDDELISVFGSLHWLIFRQSAFVAESPFLGLI